MQAYFAKWSKIPRLRIGTCRQIVGEGKFVGCEWAVHAAGFCEVKQSSMLGCLGCWRIGSLRQVGSALPKDSGTPAYVPCEILWLTKCQPRDILSSVETSLLYWQLTLIVPVLMRLLQGFWRGAPGCDSRLQWRATAPQPYGHVIVKYIRPQLSYVLNFVWKIV